MKIWVHSFLAVTDDAFGAYVNRGEMNAPEDVLRLLKGSARESAEAFYAAVTLSPGDLARGLGWSLAVVAKNTRDLRCMLMDRVKPVLVVPRPTLRRTIHGVPNS